MGGTQGTWLALVSLVRSGSCHTTKHWAGNKHGRRKVLVQWHSMWGGNSRFWSLTPVKALTDCTCLGPLSRHPAVEHVAEGLCRRAGGEAPRRHAPVPPQIQCIYAIIDLVLYQIDNVLLLTYIFESWYIIQKSEWYKKIHWEILLPPISNNFSPEQNYYRSE